MKTVLITGGTGFVGRHLTELLLQNNYAVIVLTRNEKLAKQNSIYAYWNVEKDIIDENAIAKADYIVHLAGVSITEKRWTEKRKRELIDSRVNSGKLLFDVLNKVPNKVQAVISASAIGWYDGEKNRADKNYFHVEDEKSGNDFLANICKAWEESVEPVRKFGIRLVTLRLGIVLSRDGGMLKELSKSLRNGIALVFGFGKQTISWISIHDLCRMFLFSIENGFMSGIYNAVTPNPVTQKQLVTTFAKNEKENMFIRIYIPSFILKIMLGEMSIELLKSTAVSSNKIQQSNFVFNYPDINSALQNS